MAKNLVLENDAVNAQANSLATLCNNGYIRIKTTAGVTLAELRFGATAFDDAVAGVLTAKAITPEDAALADGEATKYEVYKSDGTTLLWTGTVGTSNADLVINAVNLTTGAQVTLTSLVHTVPKSV
jgi:hypothetical protein